VLLHLPFYLQRRAPVLEPWFSPLVFFLMFFIILPLILMLFPQKRAQNHGFCNVLQLFLPYFDVVFEGTLMV
jgi:ABC-type sulfate transport system permease component